MSKTFGDKKWEVYLVCQNRGDKKLASPTKTCDAKMHFMIEDAEEHLQQVTKEIGLYYGIYKSVVETLERVK